MGQDLNRLDDLGNPRWRIHDLESSQVVEEAIEILQYFRREFDARHAARSATELASHWLARALATRSRFEPVFNCIPGNRLPGRPQLRPTFVGDVVEGLIEFGLLHRLRDGIHHERVSRLSRALCRSGYASLQRLFNTNGRRHDSDM
jgi:hypothetical protein